MIVLTAKAGKLTPSLNELDSWAFELLPVVLNGLRDGNAVERKRDSGGRVDGSRRNILRMERDITWSSFVCTGVSGSRLNPVDINIYIYTS